MKQRKFSKLCQELYSLHAPSLLLLCLSLRTICPITISIYFVIHIFIWCSIFHKELHVYCIFLKAYWEHRKFCKYLATIYYRVYHALNILHPLQNAHEDTFYHAYMNYILAVTSMPVIALSLLCNENTI